MQNEIIDKKIVLSKRGKPLFHDLMLDIKNLNIDDQEIENLIDAYGRTDLKGLILKEIEKKKPTSIRAITDIKVREIFAKSDELLSTSELVQILQEQYGLDAKSNQIHEAIKNNDSLHMFGERGWGHEDFFNKLSEQDLTNVGRELIEILILTSGKQRGRVGLLKELSEKVANKSDKKLQSIIKDLNSYDINYVLSKIQKKYPKLQDLGRGNWIWSKTSRERISLSHAALRVLEEEGKPLSISDLQADRID